MDANWAFKPATAVNYDHARLPGSAPMAAPTVLPTPNTVRPPADTMSLDNDPAAYDKAKRGELVPDALSHQVIYRVIDADSRRVLWQVPEAATLRLRAYARATSAAADPPTQRKTDLEA